MTRNGNENEGFIERLTADEIFDRWIYSMAPAAVCGGQQDWGLRGIHHHHIAPQSQLRLNSTLSHSLSVTSRFSAHFPFLNSVP